MEHVRRVIFGDVLTSVGGTDEELRAEAPPSVYDEIPEIPVLISKIEVLMGEHDTGSKRPLNLAVFLYAAEHVCRICRVLK